MKRNIPKILLFLFISFLVMNVITFNPNIFLAGKYGKIIVALIGIFLLEKDLKGLIFFIKKNALLFLFWLLCLFFTIVKIMDNGMNVELVQSNFLFIFFIYFFYLLFRAFENVYRNPFYHFFKILAKTMNINFIFWTLIAIALSLNLWHTLEDRTGLGMFYDSYVQFGIFAGVSALANFMIIEFTDVRTNKHHFLMFVFYAVLVVLSNSRNAQIILFLTVALSFLPSVKKVAIKYVYIMLTAVVAVGIFYFSNELLLNEDFTEITTGRNWIWFYVFEHYASNSIFLGEGIFGLNDAILNEHISSNYYFQRLDFLYFHSSFLEAFTATGLLGLVLFILYILKSFRNKRKFSVVIVLVALLVGGAFESFLIQPTILTSFLFWFLIVDTGEREKSKKETTVNSIK